jgi:rRNA-processing protein FCF1
MDYCVIDTSSIIFGASSRKDAFSIARSTFQGTEAVISTGILHELEGMANNKGKKGADARTSLEMIKNGRVRIIRNDSYPDTWIRNIAARYKNAIVITNDTALFNQIRKTGGKAFKLSRSGILKR